MSWIRQWFTFHAFLVTIRPQIDLNAVFQEIKLFASDLQKQLIDPKPWEDKGRFDNSLPSWATSSVDSFLFVGNKFSATDAFSGNKCQAVASLPLPVLLSFPEHKLGQRFISLPSNCPVSADFQFFIIFFYLIMFKPPRRLLVGCFQPRRSPRSCIFI